MKLSTAILHSFGYFILAAAVISALFPFYWTLITSFKSNVELSYSPPSAFPVNGQWDAYLDMLFKRDFTRLLINGAIVCSVTALISVSVGTFMSYSLSKLNLSRKIVSNVLMYVLSLRMFPPMVMVLPWFVIMLTLHLVNNILALIITYVSFNMPFVVWVMKGFFEGVPKDFEEAAMIDGLSRFRAFLRITVPIVLPAIFTTMIFVFIFSWQEFLYALIFTNTPVSQTATIGVFGAISKWEIAWAKIAAAGVLASIPVIVFMLLVRKYLVRGMTFGVVKG